MRDLSIFDFFAAAVITTVFIFLLAVGKTK